MMGTKHSSNHMRDLADCTETLWHLGHILGVRSPSGRILSVQPNMMGRQMKKSMVQTIVVRVMVRMRGMRGTARGPSSSVALHSEMRSQPKSIT